jgi:putative ABC transport system permease protein
MRDLRRRWIQVVATALVLAIGIAVFAGMGGMRGWREDSARGSFQRLALHDLRVTLPEGATVEEGDLLAAIRSGGGPRPVVARERLVAPTQIDTAGARERVLTPGRIVGDGVAEGDGRLDELSVIRGQGLDGDGDGTDGAPRTPDDAVIDRSFAKFYELPDTGRIELPGGSSIRFVGQGQTPQYFLITSETGFGGESTLGVLYTSLRTAQRLAGRPGQVNEVVMRFAPGTDIVAAEKSVERSVDEALRGVGPEVTAGREEQSYTILFRDAKNDQRMMTVFGLLVLLGACVAAFNLVSRTVESERREIGIGMALGVKPRLLGLRPLLLGLEIALLGTLLGAALTAWIANAFASVFETFLPLPYFADPFRPEMFIRAALVGFALPFLAIVWPVWRGVSVQPIEAIRVGLRSAGTGGLAPLAQRIRLPGAVMAQMALRNLARTPRRTLLATIGLAAVLGSMVALVGIVDSFNKTLDVSRADTVGGAPGRLGVTLDGFYRVDGPEVRAIADAGGVAAAEPRAELLGAVSDGGEEIPVALSLVDAGSEIWRPSVDQGSFSRGDSGIVIPVKLAEDLSVGVGDEVTLDRPVLREGGDIGTQRVSVRVAAIGANPFRVFTYIDDSQAAPMGLAGLTNQLSVIPSPGTSAEQIQRELLEIPGVVTTRPVTADTDALSDTLDQFKGIIQVAAAAALALAMLMAFNLAGISIDERRREFATMFAFGLPVRSGMRVAITENMLVGVLGTLLGFAIGLLTIGWIIGSLMADTWPEIGLVRHISPGTIVLTVVVGVAVVALTPLLMIRRMTRMDIPSTLRVVE